MMYMLSFGKLKLKENKENILTIFRFYRQDGRLLIWISALALLGLAITLPLPYFYVRYLDSMIRFKDMLLFRNLILIYVGLTVVKSIMFYFKQHLLIVFNQKVMYRMRRALLKAILNTKYSYFQKNQTGYILSRIYQDINNLSPIFPNSFLNLALRMISLIASAVLIFLINWKLALFAFLISPLFFINNLVFAKRIIENSKKVREIWAQLYGKTQELLSGIYTIKCFNRENAELRYYCREQKKVLNSIVKLLVVNNISNSIAVFTQGIIPVSLFFYAFYIYLDDAITIGQIFAFFFYIFRFYGPVMSIYNYILSFQNMLPSLDRTCEILNLEKEDNRHFLLTDRSRLKSERYNTIEFRNVEFGYNDKKIFKKLSFDVEKHDFVALVGPSGSGKTTITNLLLGYVKPENGVIKVGPDKIEDIPLRKLREIIGVVAQDVHLFNRTIRANIAMGNPEASLEMIQDAARRANIHEFIMSLPHRYDTIVGEAGTNISRGERQRICIARTLVKNTPIVIFDEATSSLDADSQKMIYQTIFEIAKDTTVLLITHKLHSLKSIEKILYLNSGEIVESGSHQTLYEMNGNYRKYYEFEEL
ncbi:ATP-binding cassette domain-containing protein [candidate division KSB1 bacterium]|nr:ATP-binding cassette domain-containing protein [candidate division KSB1 bacterium]